MVTPTCLPAVRSDVAIMRVVVLLPLVPLIEMAGMRRSSSVIHDGGRVLASRIWRISCDGSALRERGSALAFGQPKSQAGDGLGATLLVPWEGDDPVAGLARAVDARPYPALAEYCCVKALHPVGDGTDC